MIFRKGLWDATGTGRSEGSMQAFVVSGISGCLFPVLPMIAEVGQTNGVQ